MSYILLSDAIESAYSQNSSDSDPKLRKSRDSISSGAPRGAPHGSADGAVVASSCAR